MFAENQLASDFSKVSQLVTHKGVFVAVKKIRVKKVTYQKGIEKKIYVNYGSFLYSLH